MRVVTLLKKELDGSLFHKHGTPGIQRRYDWMKALMERQGKNPDGSLKYAVAAHDQTYVDGDEPGVTGAPVPLRRHRLEPAPRDEVDPNPQPKIEEHGNIAQTVIKGELMPAGGFESMGKVGTRQGLPPDWRLKIAAAIETLGDLSRSWEVPTDDSPSVHGSHHRGGSGGLVEAASPDRTALDEGTRGPFRLSLSEVGAAQFPKEGQVEDNAKVAFGFGSDGEFYVNGEVVPVGAHRGEKLAHIALQGFFDTLEKNASELGAQLWQGDFEGFRKVAMDVYYNVDAPITKEALGLGQIGQGVRAAAGRLMPMAAAGAGPEVAAFRQGRHFFSTGIGKGLSSGGKMLAHNAPAAGQAAGLAAKDVGALRAMRPSTMGRRIAGETAMGAGHHMQHAGPGLMALNPAGVPMGGAIEGFTRGVGKEMAGATNRGVQRAGQALVRHAPKVGFGGEFLAGAALGTPGLGAMAGHALAPAAHGLAQHALGAGVQEASMVAPRLLPRVGQALGQGAMSLKARAGHWGGKLVGA